MKKSGAILFLWALLAIPAIRTEMHAVEGRLIPRSPVQFDSSPGSRRSFDLPGDARPGPLPNVFRLTYPEDWFDEDGQAEPPLVVFVDGHKASWLIEEPPFDGLAPDRAYAYRRESRGRSFFVVCPQTVGCGRVEVIRRSAGAWLALARSSGFDGVRVPELALKLLALFLLAWAAARRLPRTLLAGLLTAEICLLFLDWGGWTPSGTPVTILMTGVAFLVPALAFTQEWLRREGFSPLVFVLLAPIVVYGPFLLAGYTLSHNAAGSDTESRYLVGWGVTPDADPAGSGFVGEPYLVNIKRNLVAGRLPLLNMKNGLGAMGVESLLNGTFYLLNPILLWLPTQKPLYFDLFTLLHVYILLGGLYYFLRHYVSRFAAAGTTILVGLSGVTFMWANLEHYRSFAWMPTMLGAAVDIARGERPRRSAALLAFAAMCACTAGNIQEFGADFAVTTVVCLMESVTRGSGRLRTIATFAGTAISAVLISSIAFLPYFASLADGNIWANNESARSVRHVDPVWILSWIMPKVIGFHPHLFQRDVPYYWPHTDLLTVAFFFLLLGVAYGFTHRARMSVAPDVAACLFFPALIVAGLIKVVHLPFLDFVRNIPFAQQFFYVKYHLYLFALASVPIAVGLDRVAALAEGPRRRAVIRGAVAILFLLGVMVAYLWVKPNYSHQGVPWPVLRHIYLMDYGATLTAFAATIALLYWKPRHWERLLLGVFTLQSLAHLPPGYGARAEAYPVRYEAHVKTHERLLIRETATTNLLFDVESIASFDAIANRYYRDFINRFFDTANAFFSFQPLEAVLAPTQVRALQLAGVSYIYGYRVESPELVRPVYGGYAVNDPLPRAFVLSGATFASLRGVTLSKDNMEAVVSTLLKDIRSIPQPTEIRVENETVRLSGPAVGTGAVLVVNQAYSTNWSYGGQRGEPFLELWPAWPLREGAEQEVTYWPRGLSLWFRAAPVGLALLLGTLLLSGRSRRP